MKFEEFKKLPIGTILEFSNISGLNSSIIAINIKISSSEVLDIWASVPGYFSSVGYTWKVNSLSVKSYEIVDKSISKHFEVRNND